MRVAVEVLVPLRLFVCRFLSQHRINLLLALGAVAHLNLNFSKNSDWRYTLWLSGGIRLWEMKI